MIFKTTLKDINAVAVAIDKLGKITSANMSKNTIEYSLYGKAIEGLSAKQLALALSTQKLTPLQIEQIIKENDLIKTYGAEVLVKEGLISANSTLLASEKAVYAQDLQKSILKRTTNKEEAKEFIQKQLIVAANGEESASTVLLNKALMDEAVKRGVLSEEQALEILSTYGVVTADVTETASKKGLAKAIKELIASKINLSALDVSMIAGVAALAFTIYKCNKAVKEAQDKAQELGSTFKDTSFVIDDYKSKIENLYNTINDSNSSIKDVTNARKSLLSVQDELIDKFGAEKNVINEITDAINGQTEALNRLTNAKWQETKNEFNNGGFWNNVANFFQGTDNIQRMLNEYGKKTISFKWADYASINELTDDMVAKLENIGIDIRVNTDNLQSVRDFDSLTESISDTKGASLSITGNAEEIYGQLLALQNLIGNDESFAKLYDRVESTANSYKDLTDTYKDFYNQYILYEKILTENSAYADKFKDITDAYEKYQEAFTSGDKDKIKETTENYAKVLTEATSTAIANGNSDVATYFESMYPTLKSTVESWKFNVAFEANTDNLQNSVQSVLDELKDENGRSLTTEEILGLGEANEQYQNLVSIAHAYNISIEEMIELLKERNLVSAMDYQGLVGLFGHENVDKLSPEDLEIAYQIKNVGNITFEQLQAEIEKAKKVADENPISFNITTCKDQIDDFQSKVKTLGDALSSIRSGKFADSDLTDLLQEFPELTDKSDDLEAALVELINNSLTVLYDTLGDEVPDSLKTSLQELTDISSGAAVHLNDAFSSIHSSWDVLQDFKDAMASGFDDNITDSLLQSVRDLNGELEILVAGYYSGVVTAAELYEALTKHYENDLHNYSEALIKKNDLNTDFYNAVGMASEEVINQFMDDYDVDLENCKSYNEAKLEIEKQTLGQISSIWSQYYDAQSKTLKVSMSEIEARAAHGGGDASAFLEQYKLIENYEAAMEALNNITYNGIKTNFESISSKLNTNSSSSSKSSSTEETKEFSEELNWVEKLVNKVSSALDKLKDKVSNTYIGWSIRNHSLSKAMEKTNDAINVQQQAYEKYMQKAASVGLSQEYINKIQNGSLNIEDITDEALSKQIETYTEW